MTTDKHGESYVVLYLFDSVKVKALLYTSAQVLINNVQGLVWKGSNINLEVFLHFRIAGWTKLIAGSLGKWSSHVQLGMYKSLMKVLLIITSSKLSKPIIAQCSRTDLSKKISRSSPYTTSQESRMMLRIHYHHSWLTVWFPCSHG